jgi:opacity protein-like surface antigen
MNINTLLVRSFVCLALAGAGAAEGAPQVEMPPIYYNTTTPTPATSAHDDAPRRDWKAIPTDYFARGWYAQLDGGTAAVSANFPCNGPACAPGENIHFQSLKGDGPNIRLTGGYRLWRYFAVQAQAMGFGQGENHSRYNTPMIINTAFDDLTEVHLAARVDLPLSPYFALYATYGIGYKKVTFSTDEATPGRLEGPDLYVDTRRAGTYRPAALGFIWYTYNTAHFGQSLGLEYAPPAGGAGFALSQWAFTLGFHW